MQLVKDSNTPTYVLFGPRVSAQSKAEMVETLGVEEIPVDFGPFGSGAIHCELFPYLKGEREGKSAEEHAARFKEMQGKLQGSRVIVVESTGEQPHVADSIERVRAASATLKEYGAKEVVVAMPNTAYDRQDRGFNEEGRLCSINAKWFAKDLKSRGVDKVITITPHSVANEKFWQDALGAANYEAITATELFADDLHARYADISNVVIGAPDGADKPNDLGQARARALAAAMHGIAVDDPAIESHLFKIGKAHVDTSETKITSFSGDVADKDCVIVDDMSDGGSTLINAAKLLKEKGARSVSAYATHALCTIKEKDGVQEKSLEKLLAEDAQGNSPLDTLVFTDSVPEILGKKAELSDAQQSRVNVLSIGKMFGKALKEFIEREPNFVDFVRGGPADPAHRRA